MLQRVPSQCIVSVLSILPSRYEPTAQMSLAAKASTSCTTVVPDKKLGESTCLHANPHSLGVIGGSPLMGFPSDPAPAKPPPPASASTTNNPMESTNHLTVCLRCSLSITFPSSIETGDRN